jgi:hypothetical protein
MGPRGWDANGTGSGSCPGIGFDVSGVEHSGYATIMLVNKSNYLPSHTLIMTHALSANFESRSTKLITKLSDTNKNKETTEKDKNRRRQRRNREETRQNITRRK